MAWGSLQSFNPKLSDVPLEGEVVLDKRRRPITDAVLPRSTLSSPHCKLYQEKGGDGVLTCYVVDLGR
jgi:hypothetical protein